MPKIKHFLILVSALILTSHSVMAGPQSTTYELKDYGFGSGGSAGTDSTNYSLFGIAGETDFGSADSTNYGLRPGLTATIQANVPPAPTFTNPSNYYNKLKLVIATGDNPSDATFAIAISADNFASDTRYVQNDNTVGATLGSEDWQTYANWGGASGFNIIGLLPSTTYTVKVEAEQGNFTQTGFGPTAQASTVGAKLTFDIDVSSTDTDTDPPFTVSVGSLTPASVTTASNKVWVDFDTNGENGANVYVYGTNSGLLSSQTSYTISSATANLSSGAVAEGFGAISSSVAQSSGGPVEAVSPYNGASNNVGVLDSSKRIIFDSSNAAVGSGRAAFELKAKASTVTPSAADYSETLTVITSAAY